jgi:hypothetical protein
MKWFNKHLNWITFSYTIFAWAIGILLIEFYLHIKGWEYLPFFGWDYIPLNSPEIDPGLFLTFTYQAMADVAILISLPVFGWILKKKKRSLWFLLFFLPPLVPVPSVLFVIIFQMPFYVIGWIILLASNNKTDIKTPANT